MAKDRARAAWHDPGKVKIHALRGLAEAGLEEHGGLGNFKMGTLAARTSSGYAAGAKIDFMRIS